MQLVEQHRIDRHDARFAAIDQATFASKHLYNAALYLTRQAYIHEENRVIGYGELDKLLQPTAEYRALPAKVAQWVLKQACAAWDSYFAAVAEWRQNPGKFLGHPKLPKYLPKQGRNLLVYTTQAISRDPKNAGWVVPSGVPIRVATKRTYAEMAQVRLVPKATHYVVEVVYEQEPHPPDDPPLDPTLIASVDLGVNVLAAITSNKPGFSPLLVHVARSRVATKPTTNDVRRLKRSYPQTSSPLARWRRWRMLVTVASSRTCTPPVVRSSISWCVKASARW